MDGYGSTFFLLMDTILKRALDGSQIPEIINFCGYPPVWGIQNWKEVRWDGRFLALLSGHYLVIIEFQPQSILLDP